MLQSAGLESGSGLTSNLGLWKGGQGLGRGEREQAREQARELHLVINLLAVPKVEILSSQDQVRVLVDFALGLECAADTKLCSGFGI